MLRSKSLTLFEKGMTLIPGGVNSPVRAAKELLSHPLIVEKGLGSTIWDVDGNSYLDYCMSWGALILGHAHPKIVKAATKQIEKGSSFGITTSLEIEMADLVIQKMPVIEKLRLVSSGTESTMTAIRLARGYTRRPKIVKFAGHYHGHVDSLLMSAGSGAYFINSEATSLGVNASFIKDTISLPFNDFEALKELFSSPLASEIGAVIVEPIAANMGLVPPLPGFLEELRILTKKNNTLLIMDEVITGFRVSLHGASSLFNIDPDLVCLGKVIGGGFPVAALGGKKKIMETLAPMGPVYQAGTLSGNPVGVAAGICAIQELSKVGIFESLEKKGERLASPIQKVAIEKNLNLCIQRVGSLFTLFFGLKRVTNADDLKKLDAAAFTKFFQYMFQNGVYIPPSQNEAWFISLAHSDEELDRTAFLVTSYLRSL